MSDYGFVAWILIGLISGFLAGKVMKGGGFGVIGDIIVGLVGSLIGGFVLQRFITGNSGFIGSIFVAFVGACILIALTRVIAGRSAV